MLFKGLMVVQQCMFNYSSCVCSQSTCNLHQNWSQKSNKAVCPVVDVMCYCTYRGVQGGGEGSVGEAVWETWWSGSDSSCCLYDNYKEKERERHVNMTGFLTSVITESQFLQQSCVCVSCLRAVLCCYA